MKAKVTRGVPDSLLASLQILFSSQEFPLPPSPSLFRSVLIACPLMPNYQAVPTADTPSSPISLSNEKHQKQTVLQLPAYLLEQRSRGLDRKLKIVYATLGLVLTGALVALAPGVMNRLQGELHRRPLPSMTDSTSQDPSQKPIRMVVDQPDRVLFEFDDRGVMLWAADGSSMLGVQVQYDSGI